MLRVQSHLPADLENLVHRTIGCCIQVHRALGVGLLESIYSKAVRLELTAAGIPFEHEKQIPVLYRGAQLCHQRLDLVIADKVVLEIKCVERLHPVHRAQLMSYMRVSGLSVGLLMNFNVPILQDGLVRMVL